MASPTRPTKLRLERRSPIDVFGVWAADIEMDGDIDVIVGSTDGPPFVLRNNGDRRGARSNRFEALRRFADSDGPTSIRMRTPMRCSSTVPGCCTCSRTARRVSLPAAAGVSGIASVVGMTVADIDADGAFDLVALEASGTIRQVSWQGTEWRVVEIAKGLVRAGADAGAIASLPPISTTAAPSICSPPVAGPRSSGWRTRSIASRRCR